ncbi:Eaa protein [Enterobacter hormaechei]|uniref:Eaa protein n=1 Tax=Enterobacter hormaechei TaxID=158836 RepID=UPI002738A878|nr:Eaa protein [Enterobacter hormaechei]
MELSKQFTKEQLIELAREDIAAISSALQLNMSDEANELLQKSLANHEIALAALTIPEDVPRPVFDVIYQECGGFVDSDANPQVIWDACRAAMLKGGAK